MGVGVFIKNLFSPNAAGKLAKTNRAFYNRGLCLIVTARLLPDPPKDPVQIGRLKEVFRSIESALDIGSFPHNKSDLEQAKLRFDEANTKLQNYLNDYLAGVHLRSYMTTDRGPLLSFDDAVKEDISANNALENFSKTIVEKVESIKASPRRTIDVTFWGAIPVQATSEALKYNSNRVADIIQIEKAARIDTLLHRAMEYATMPDISGARILKKLRTLELGLYPQFYRNFPVEPLEEGRKIVSLTPWTKVADLSGDQPLHILPNRHVIEDSKAKFDSFYEKDMSVNYSNAWPFLDRDGKRVGNSLAVRNRTPSHSISLLSGAQIPTSQSYHQPQPHAPYSHFSGVSSSRTLVNPPTSSSMTSAPSQANSFLTPGVMKMPEPVVAAPPMPEPQLPKIDHNPPPPSVSSPPRQGRGKEMEIPQRIPSDENNQRTNSQNTGPAQVGPPAPVSVPLSTIGASSPSRPGTPNSEILVSGPGGSSQPRPRATLGGKSRKVATERTREEISVIESTKKPSLASRVWGSIFG